MSFQCMYACTSIKYSYFLKIDPQKPSVKEFDFSLCNNFGTVLDFARSALKLVLLDSHKTYLI